MSKQKTIDILSRQDTDHCKEGGAMQSIKIEISFSDLSNEKKIEVIKALNKMEFSDEVIEDVVKNWFTTIELSEEEEVMEDESESKEIRNDIFWPGHSRGWRYRNNLWSSSL